MADNYAFTPGTGATGAADDIGGILYPRSKLSLGADGAAVDAIAGHGGITTAVQRVVQAGYEYETVAASQTAQVIGATGAAGDYLKGLLVIPATTGAGLVTILDNAISIPVYISGTLVDLKPFFIPLELISVSGAWKVTTGANVSVIAIGKFTA
jgi:hypothetical protein